MTYAADTKVPVDKSRAEIEQTLKRYGADRFMWFTEPQRAVLVFECGGRRIRFDLPLPDGKDRKTEQTHRARWRALLLCLKAKLEAVESKIETFEEAFLAHVVLPDGKTVADHARPRIAEAYEGGEIPNLLPGPTDQKRPK